MDNYFQEKVIDINVGYLTNKEVGFATTFCSDIKNQVLNIISICDINSDLLDNNYKDKLDRIKRVLI